MPIRSLSAWTLILLAFVSCESVEPSFPCEGDACAGVIEKTSFNPYSGPRPRDVLIVLDDGIPSGRFAARLETGLRELVGNFRNLITPDMSGTDLNVALVSAAAAGGGVPTSLWPTSPSCPMPSGAFLHSSRLCDAPTNFQGDLTDVVACSAMHMPSSGQEPRPLETIRALLAPGELGKGSGFRRKDARLHLAIISTKDDPALAAVGAISEYRKLLATAVNLEGGLTVGILAPESARGLREFAESFGEDGYFTDIDDDRWEALAWVSEFRLVRSLSYPCVDGPLADADPNTPGIQPDCLAIEKHPMVDHWDEEILPRCPEDGAIPSPCWKDDWQSPRCRQYQFEFVVKRPEGECLPRHSIMDELFCLLRPH